MKDNRKFNWFTVENSLIDREDTTPMETLMYVVLARYANNNEKCFPGLDLISKKTGIKDKRTITKHLKSLSEKGFITIQKRPGKSNLYYLNNVEEVVTKNVPTTKIVPPTKNVPAPPTKNVPTSSDKKCTSKKNYLKRTNKKEKEKEKATSFDGIIKEYTTNGDLQETIYDFIKMRKAIKKTITDRGLKTLLTKLDKIDMKDEIKIEILENSILNSWSSIYPLKQDQPKFNNYKKEVKKYGRHKELTGEAKKVQEESDNMLEELGIK